jgi:hypothetical protein
MSSGKKLLSLKLFLRLIESEIGCWPNRPIGQKKWLLSGLIIFKYLNVVRLVNAGFSVCYLYSDAFCFQPLAGPSGVGDRSYRRGKFYNFGCFFIPPDGF